VAHDTVLWQDLINLQIPFKAENSFTKQPFASQKYLAPLGFCLTTLARLLSILVSASYTTFDSVTNKQAETLTSLSWSQIRDLPHIRSYFNMCITSILHHHTKNKRNISLIIKDTFIIGRYVKVLNITFMVIYLS
jgi:hypothetical protein